MDRPPSSGQGARRMALVEREQATRALPVGGDHGPRSARPASRSSNRRSTRRRPRHRRAPIGDRGPAGRQVVGECQPCRSTEAVPGRTVDRRRDGRRDEPERHPPKPSRSSPSVRSAMESPDPSALPTSGSDRRAARVRGRARPGAPPARRGRPAATRSAALETSWSARVATWTGRRGGDRAPARGRPTRRPSAIPDGPPRPRAPGGALTPGIGAHPGTVSISHGELRAGSL